jgi:hypothetical protein
LQIFYTIFNADLPPSRVHLPNNVAVGAKHRDFDYNHPEGEINFWLPVTTGEYAIKGDAGDDRQVAYLRINTMELNSIYLQFKMLIEQFLTKSIRSFWH